MEMLMLALLMLAAVLVSSVIDQLVPKISSPLIQIGLGLAIAIFTNEQIDISLDPELFMVLFIAPLLYDEAKNIDKAALWKNRKPVLSLAIGLVIATALIVGGIVHALVPSIALAAAFALGAALGPTDAVAVASLSQEADIAPRHKSILAAESIMNDASGVVAFQFAIAAAVTGTFSLIDASADFAVSFFGGALCGLALGYLGNFLVRRVRSWGLENTTFHVLFEVFTPFIVYLAANSFGASGIIAVVAAGLVNVISPRSSGPQISRMNIVSSNVWHVLAFTLNGIVFVLLGTQLPRAMQGSWESVAINNVVLVGYVLAIAAATIAVRFLWVFVMERVSRKEREDCPRPTFKDMVRSALVMTLAGPKGALTLVIAFTIPFALTQRSLMIFLVSGVILVTLLLATFVVPLLAPKSGPSEEDAKCDETEVALDILRSVIEDLTGHQCDENRTATQAVIASYNARIAHVKEHKGISDEPNTALRIEAVIWEQEHVLKLIEDNDVNPVVGYHYLHRLEQIESLLEHSGGHRPLQRRRLHARAFIRSLAHRLVRDLPGVSESQRMEAVRTLQLDCAEHVITKLRALIASPDSSVPTEDATSLLLEYQRTVSALRSTSPSITVITDIAAKVVPVKRHAYELELEYIQTHYEAGDLCRSAATRLRENVYLMQLDLEDNG